MLKDYTNLVVMVAEAKYDLERDVVESYEEVIALCYVNNYTPRRTVEVIATDIFK